MLPSQPFNFFFHFRVVFPDELAGEGIHSYSDQLFQQSHGYRESCAKDLLLTFKVHLVSVVSVQRMMTVLWD